MSANKTAESEFHVPVSAQISKIKPPESTTVRKIDMIEASSVPNSQPGFSIALAQWFVFQEPNPAVSLVEAIFIRQDRESTNSGQADDDYG